MLKQQLPFQSIMNTVMDMDMNTVTDMNKLIMEQRTTTRAIF
jgi:hypothetical protein